MSILNIGLDIGSTTAKLSVMDGDEVIYGKYMRHMAQARGKAAQMLDEASAVLDGHELKITVSGSAGLGLAQSAGFDYIQEVFASGELVKKLAPSTDIVVELGGEDAKIIYFRGTLDERMNGSCAGGTGAFIDQMASLMNVTPDELDELSLKSTNIYPIASRCGVFAKTDIQPLINQGARREDIAASIYQAVVNQTIAGLARGRRIEGNVMFLGGPLYYNKGLRKRFTETLGLTEATASFPEYGRFSVAIGAALCSRANSRTYTFSQLQRLLCASQDEVKPQDTLPPLFSSRAEYEEFVARHKTSDAKHIDIEEYSGDAYLGIDCGSTTTKLVLIDGEGSVLYSFYDTNRGNPVEVVRGELIKIRALCADRIRICSSASTGYGEELIKNAFALDCGIVETVAHLKAATHFNPMVQFLIDIGGQDIKCFKIKNGAIDTILLNEACSSGCGSFLETFAHTMSMSIEEFSRLGLFAPHPVNLGSRCTVFMNSSVKQAQKNGASVEDISAGLSCSVVNNALYKVIRITNTDQLGEHIVVQGGTFLNDAVLRSFEQQTGRQVTRPSISGVMGAYGAALYALEHKKERSSLLSAAQLDTFSHSAKTVRCSGCENRCMITVNTFSDSRKFISGNRCERVYSSGAGQGEKLPNLHEYKRNMLARLFGRTEGKHTVGIPLGLNMYELAPFWHAFFTSLGFGVILTDFADLHSYSEGQQSIPSDTACYPAKLVHGQIEKLAAQKPDVIFYPCMTWNIDEGRSFNCYNCPLVAYYPEVVAGNMDTLSKIPFLYPYLDINNKAELARELYEALSPMFGSVSRRAVSTAVKRAFEALDRWNKDVAAEGRAAVEYARKNNRRIMVLAGRPYHIDPLVGHGTDTLAQQLGFVVISEDAAAAMSNMPKTAVINQWTYHSRMYAAADFAVRCEDAELVQLVSFGCGLDAITTDEIRELLEENGKLYTQLKIDEITNLGAVTIRLRSLLSAIEARENK